MKNSPAVIIHGGGGKAVEKNLRPKLPFLKQARDQAWEKIASGEPGEEAVVAALRVMEGCEYFNAGFGSYPNADGIVLTDIGLMRGDLCFLSLMNVRRVVYPSSIALDMLKVLPNLMASWTYKREQKLDQASAEIKTRYGLKATNEEMIASFVKHLLRHQEEIEVSSNLDDEVHGTVGCVVRDKSGMICAGTSTGGTGYKLNGRVGDSPIIGAGVYADSEVCGISATGHGESILGCSLSGYIIADMRHQLRKDPEVFLSSSDKLLKLIQAEVDSLQEKTGSGGAGVIVMPPCGRPRYAYSTQMLSVAACFEDANGSEQKYTLIDRKEEENIELND